MYSLIDHGGANAFLERAESWLLEREDLNNLVLSLAYARAASGSSVERPAKPSADEAASSPAERADDLVATAADLFATVEDDDDVVGCVIRTPPRKVLVTDLPVDAAQVVAEGLVERYQRIPAVLGREPVADAIAGAWVERMGGSRSAGMRQRLHRLKQVTAPEGVPGRLRLAGPADLELAVEWGPAFAEEAGVPFPDPRGSAERWIDRGGLFLWDVDGRAVSITVASGRTPHGVRVGYVYTPPEERRSGYASACVAAVSQRLLDDGYDFCVLYTDLDNPTSNAIYARIGYEPIEDVRDIDIHPPDEA